MDDDLDHTNYFRWIHLNIFLSFFITVLRLLLRNTRFKVGFLELKPSLLVYNL